MIEILRAGLYDSIQDLGRTGFQNFGVPLSGAMDKASAKLANGLLDNDVSEPVIEMTMMGPKLKFHCRGLVCITGGHIALKLNGNPIEMNNPIVIGKNDVMECTQISHGARSYLAIEGGFDCQTVMGSCSQYQNITEHYRLEKGDVIQLKSELSGFPAPQMSSKIRLQDFSDEVVEVYAGPEYELLNDVLSDTLAIQEFTIAPESNRMAFQFKERLAEHDHSIITSLVIPGTVQYTPSGQLVVLMRDAQTTGGYPRVFQVSDRSIDLLSQKKPDEKIRFKVVEYKE